MEIKFTRAKDQDWQTVASLEKASAGTKLYFPYTEEQKVRDYIKKSIVFIAYLGGEAVGTISYELKSKDHAELDGLTVHPDQRGKGIARKAVTFVMGKLEGKKVTTVVHPENQPAIKLYLDSGMKVTGRKDNYYGDGEPRLLMTKAP